MANDYYVISGDSLRDIADTIRTKGGTSAQLEFPNGWMDAIDDIQTGGSAVIQALNVTQNGTYTVPTGVDGYSPVTVSVSGGDEVPDDGKTRIWISIAEGTPDNRLTFYLRFKASVANNTTVDWGDGTTQTLGSTTATNYSHKYAKSGEYIIIMTVKRGTIAFEGSSGSSGFGIYGARTNTNIYNKTRIKQVVFGNNVTAIGEYTFYYCYNLKSITLSNSITSIGSNAFNCCYALTSITIPDSVTSIGSSAFSSCYALTSVIVPKNITVVDNYIFYYCHSLTSITIPDGVTSIGNNAFNCCYALTSITIPDSVTSIGTSAFTNCHGVSEYHLKSTTPPALSHTNIFYNIPSDCIIYVPYSADHSILDTYKTATNWSTYASKMQEEPT